MPFHYKALVIVMVVTSIMFALARPLFSRFMAAEDFARRRNLWLALTLAAFLIPNFWLFMLVAAAIIGFGGAKDSNPAALYMLLLLALPPIREDIPSFGLIKQVFGLDHLRLLSLALLLPAAARLRAAGEQHAVERRGLAAADMLILLYAVLQCVLMLPYESATASGRRMLLLVIDMLLPYFVISRTCRSKAMILDSMACFALAAVVLAPLAVIEFLRGWILYAGLEDRWGAPYMMEYLKRGDYLRAQVTAGHAIVLGNAMAVAFGLWLYLQTRVSSWGWRALAMATLLAGLAVTLARGPWVGATAMLLLFLALGPNAASRSAKAFGLLAVAGGIALATPLGDKLIDYVPFVGSVDDDTVTYRQRLAEMSWLLIRQNPLFGSPSYMAYMEDLRQGEGIIDLVNAYAGVALSYGLVGLALFAGFFGVIVTKCVAAVRRLAPHDPDFSLMGAALVACIGGALVILATASNYLSVTYIYWSLAALGTAYVELTRHEVPAHSGAESAPAQPRSAGGWP